MNSFNYILLFMSLSLLTLMVSCHPKPKTLTGHYESVNYNIFQYAWVYLGNGRFAYPVGSSIHLYKNDSFTYSTCGTTTKGHWEARNDTLYLYGETAIWSIDSFQEHSFNGRWPKVGRDTYVIKRNHLYKREKLISVKESNSKNGEIKNYDNKKVLSIEKLRKVEDY